MIAGGHSIDTVEPIYGLVVVGIVDPKKLKRNNAAKAGDKIILSKSLGVGILSAALKKEVLSDAGYQQMIELTTQLNKPGAILAESSSVHALTDVTGFGLAGHLLEMARGSNLKAQIYWKDIPVIEEAAKLAQKDIFTGASTRNWAAYGHEVKLASNMVAWQKNLLTDPQTSGGLLISCAPEAEQEVLELLKATGFSNSKTIGTFIAGVGLSVS